MHLTLADVSHEWDIEHRACRFHTDEDLPCKRPAVALYVTADSSMTFLPICREHATSAAGHGDGPVYVLGPRWPMVR